MAGKTSLKTWLVMAMFLIAIGGGTSAGQIIYVDADAPGANDGSSWTDAYNYLQDALADANSGDEIHVAEGIYTPDSNSADPSGSGDRTATFQLINGISLKGGYAGFGELDPNVRDIEAYETILSGDLDGNDIDVNNIDVNDLWYLWEEPSRAENSYHVVTGSGTDETAVLDGFTITGGNANGVYNIHNNLGGGMYTDSGSVAVTNCTFRCNSARHNGGGMYNSSSVLSIINCTFQANRAKHGGGMQNQTSALTFINCMFTRNTGSFATGGMGIYDSNAILTDCAFSGNKARCIVGGLYSIDSNLTLTNCTFTGNSVPWPAGMGCGGAGGIAISGDNAIVIDCVFSGNSARWGGGMVSDPGSLTLTNCIFSGNSAYSDGGGIYNISQSIPTTLTNCTFSGNSAVYGGGGIYHEYASSVTLTNCILWGNTALRGPQVEMVNKSVMEISYSCIEGCQAGIYDPYQGLIWGTGNIDSDPCFVQQGYWEDPCGTPDKHWDDVWVDGDYHLKSQAGRWDANEGRWTIDEVTSPCIDAGNPADPIGHEPFPNGGIINMGAYGGTAEASKSYFGEPVCETIVAGDINGDCKVNFVDFTLMAFHWLEDNTPVSAVTTTYLFQPDPNALRTSGGFHGQGKGTYSIESKFELTINYDAGTASFDNVDATINEEILFWDYYGEEPIYTDSLDVLFHMTELVSTNVNGTAIEFVFEKNIPTFPGADVHLQVIFLDDSVRLVGGVCDAVYDGYCYHLDAVAVRKP